MPHLDYCVTVWGDCSDLNKLTRLQKQAARIILDCHYLTPSKDMFCKLKWLPMKDWVKYRKATMTFKAINGNAPDYIRKGKGKKVWFYIALYPVHWTAQSALHFPPLADLFIPTPFSASLGSILAMQQLRNDYSITFPPLSIARYSFIQLSRLRRREVKENAQTSKR